MQKKKLRTRTKFVIISIISVLSYTAVVLWLSYKERTVPSELTVAYFAFFGSEIILLAGLKLGGRDNNDGN